MAPEFTQRKVKVEMNQQHFAAAVADAVSLTPLNEL